MRAKIEEYKAVEEAATKFVKSVAEGNSKYARELFIDEAVLFGYLVNVAQAIYRAALYQYAEGMEVVVFSEEELAGAFRSKK